ncbi:MAG TPA: flagellar assembly protein FliW [Spirochaetota bacterium]|nr:flagellar assembly protein FliW [Spirochaetota bacterium]HOL57357.1 flagellar assembly protein FliW [Spirochaetota bacterium]HPP04943.1 flagellar assembly protein FliW [Spirochaetota bacterium]
MKIKTKIFGEVEVSEKQRIYFESGILGFEDLHSFFLIDIPDSNGPFYWLQSEESIDIGFVVITPETIMPDYKLEVEKSDLEKIDIKSESDILLFSIVTLYEDPSKNTVNLLGPIIINKRNLKAIQAISLNENYSVRHPLIKRGEQ